MIWNWYERPAFVEGFVTSGLITNGRQSMIDTAATFAAVSK